MAAMTSGVYALLSIWKTMKMVKYFYFFFWNFNESLGLLRYKTKGENVIKTRTFFFFILNIPSVTFSQIGRRFWVLTFEIYKKTFLCIFG